MAGQQVIRTLTEEQKPVDLTATLLEKRIVFYSDEVNSETANKLVKQLLYLDALSDDPITLYINSPGGSVVDGMGIYDTIQRIKAPVHAVVCGMAASMGAVILSGCEKGHRYVLPHAEVLLAPTTRRRSWSSDRHSNQCPAYPENQANLAASPRR